MASLSTIPADLCLCISDILSQTDRNALARTDRRFYFLINPRIYRHNVRHDNASALWWAIEHCCRATAEHSLNQGADIDAREGPSGDTLLTKAVGLRVGAEYYANLGSNCPPFRTRMMQLDSIITLLLERGVDINARGLGGQTAFHKACAGSDEAFVREFITRRADISMTDAKLATGLHIAAGCTFEGDVIRFLIEQGLSVHAFDNLGRTPLYAAIRTGNVVSMKVLLENGADVDARDDEGITPLMDSVCWYRLGPRRLHEMVDTLLRYGADTKAVNVNGQTVLHIAVEFHLYTAVVQKLIDSGVDVSAQDNQGKTALHLARSLRRRDLYARLSRRSNRLSAKPRVDYVENNNDEDEE